MASRSKLLRLRSFRRAALRGLAWALAVGLLGAALLASAGLTWPAIVAVALATGLAQSIAGLVEVAAGVDPDDAREWPAARAGLATGLVTFAGVVLAVAQADAAPHLMSGRPDLALRALRGLQPDLAALLALPAALVVGCATWVRHGPPRRSHRRLLVAVALVALPIAILWVALSRDPVEAAILALPGAPIATTVTLILSTLLAGVHGWLDRLERRALPPLPDEG